MQHECKENSALTWAQYIIAGGVISYWGQHILNYFNIKSVGDAVKLIQKYSQDYFKLQDEKIRIQPCVDFNDFLVDTTPRSKSFSIINDIINDNDASWFPKPAFGTKYACPDEIEKRSKNYALSGTKMSLSKQSEADILAKYKKFEGLTVSKFSTAVALSGYSIHILNVNMVGQPNAKVFSNKVIGIDISSFENTIINRDTIGNCIVTKVRNIGGIQNR